MPTFTQNLNEIIDTKKEIASIIKERGVDPGDTFSDYPTYLRSVMASGDIAGLDNYVSKLELSYQSYVQLPYFNSTLENYVQEGFLATNYIDYSYLYSYIGKTVDDLILGTVDLEPYVTHTELESYNYVSEDELGVVKENGGLKMKDASNTVSSNAAYSLATGLGVQTKNVAEFGSGKYNYSINNAQAHTISTIGIGNSEDRKNAVAVLSENGKMYVFGVGDYNGQEIVRTVDGVTYIAKSLQEVLAEVPSYEFTYSYIESSIRGFLGSIDFGSYVTYAYLGSALSDLETDLMNDINNTPTYAYLYTYVGDALRDIDVDVDLSDYPTFDDISDMGYITAADIPDVDLDDYPTYTYLYTYVGDALNEYAPDLTYYPTFDDISDMGYITSADVDLDDYVTYTYLYTYVTDALSDIDVDLTDYPTFDDISDMGYITAADVPEVNLSYVLSTYNLRYINETPFGNGKQLYLLNSGLDVADTGSIFPQTYSYSQIVNYLNNDSSRLWIGGPTMKNYVEGRIAELESSSVTPSYLADNYVSYGYASANYVSYSYAYNTFVSYAYLGDLEQISEYILGSGSSSAPENVYATKTELGAYVSKDLLSTLGYITAGDVDIPVINENLIPKEDNTYTLGDATYYYANAYMCRLSSPQGGLNIRNGSTNVLTIGGGDIRPYADLRMGLGRSNNRFSSTYTAYLYTNTAYLQDTSYTKSIVPDGTDTYFLGDTSNYYHSTYTNRIRGNSSINFVVASNNRLTVSSTAFRPMQQNYNLGSSDYPFATAYISNIYNFIWTGTSAEYALLDNYTSYQIYMIEKDVN